jgi:16S rRNA (adenine1518-N6/adenine1519-N6)-dimethyltransferase
MTPETLKQLLIDYGLKPNKTFGQNFLMDEIVLQDMVDVAEVDKKDVIVEVGPGITNLTKFLLDKAGQVISIEKDDQFIPILNSLKKKYKNFSYVHSDVLQVDLEKLTEGFSKYKVVANIPYYVTGKIIQKFLSVKNKPLSMTLLMQKEVAENLTSKPGNLNLLAISVQLHGEARLVEIVPAQKFYPAPKVNSAVVHIELFKKPKYEIEDEKFFFKVIKACFLGKRKQIHNTLTNNLKLEKKLVEQILKDSNLSPDMRPQQLSIPQWITLIEKIVAQKK